MPDERGVELREMMDAMVRGRPYHSQERSGP